MGMWMDDSRPTLCQVPTPLDDESCSSWLARLSCLHGASVAQILGAVGLGAVGDLDVRVGRHYASRIAYGTNVSPHALREFVSRFDAFRRERWLRRLLLRSETGTAHSSYCARCIAGDDIPYLRFEWRMRYWVICPSHSCPMLNRCWACMTTYPLTTVAPWRSETPFLSCSICGADLREAPPNELPLESTQAVLDLQRAVTAAIIRGSFSVGQMPERLPLALLPSLLAAGAIGDPWRLKEMGRVDPRLFDDIRWNIQHMLDRRTTSTGFDVAASRGNTRGRRVWKGDIGKICEIALKQRFLWPLALLNNDASQERHFSEFSVSSYRAGYADLEAWDDV
ncbi:hypothetical protein LMG26686_00943 [Achromobacter mucicolens]|uniref:TniQ family protein n=1 Tax=Achromobacter mucicolens TaxID=1389922 RepID=UPI0014655154|nr:hypothetical protein LMG26686_00943 [Achromobacter mucicolens]